MATKAKFRLLLFLVFTTFSVLNFKVASAVCPVCTVAVAGGLGISRWLGIDDFITSIWIGGLALSVSAWCWNFLKKKGKLNGASGIAVLLLVYASILLPLYMLKYIGDPQNTLWGYDKIILGVIVGTAVFWLGAFTNAQLKKRNEGKAYFRFQKVVLPVSLLLIASAGYYIYCKCYNLF